ncbi:ABC transporter substrate-binding protein [Saccharopolyspora taberi]|uniref:ABC transporter substrate-binding protein n=1 Tax=Saccharopolyspora taberi TaxID=60895 RepID=A0ABN3VER8_9PSEU
MIALAALSAALTGCSAAASDDVEVVVGYQSKTINTVTAGTLLRATGFLERRLDELGRRTGKRYSVSWQDFSTGAPITAQMLAGKIDIGSMGDYPLLINGSRARGGDGTKLVSVTGYNQRGALNMVVSRPGSPVRELGDLAGKRVSTSVGSAAHGTLVQALRRAGAEVSVQNQEPAVGASTLESGGAEGLAQFVAWPGLLVFQGKARPVYDGAELDVPTLHGVVARDEVIEERPEVLDAFLKAQFDATRYLHEDPLRSARQVADATGLPPEVVYLYNGAGGQVTFDPTIKPGQREALAADVPFLKEISALQELDLGSFIDDGPLRAAYGDRYDADAAGTANPSPIRGTDPVCGAEVRDPATAGEVWLSDEDSTSPAVSPTCLLRQIRQAETQGRAVRAAYVPDALTGTRWFADKATWVRDPAASPESRFVPFATPASARRYQAEHLGAVEVGYRDAIGEA